MTILNVRHTPDAVEVVINDECEAAGRYFPCPKYVVFRKINAVLALSGAIAPLPTISLGIEYGIEREGIDIDLIAAGLPDWLVELYTALAENDTTRPASMDAHIALAGYSPKLGRMAAWLFTLSPGKCDVTEMGDNAALMPGDLPAVAGYAPKSMDDLLHAARLQNRHAKASLGPNFPAAGSMDCLTVRRGSVDVERLAPAEWQDAPKAALPGKWGFLGAIGVPVKLSA